LGELPADGPAALATLRFPPMVCAMGDAALPADALRHWRH